MVTKEQYELACIKKEELRKKLFEARFEANFTKDLTNVNQIKKELSKIMYLIKKYENQNGIEDKNKERNK